MISNDVSYNTQNLIQQLMLSYRHAFHAGNHADVLKHWVYSLVLDYFNQKDKAYWVMDTHAGAGVYALNQAMANKTAEYQAGIARLQAQQAIPAIFSDYLQAVDACQTQANIPLYPGSPAIANYFLRDSDKLRLFELHPADHALLAQHFASHGRHIQIGFKDGFDGIKACLPPPTKRGLVLIDPPYELKEDYSRVVDCLKDSIKRFATGTYLVWYPMLMRTEPDWMIAQLKTLAPSYLHVGLQVKAPQADGFGMIGSGMFIVNPPWLLAAQLAEGMPWLTQTLGQDATATHLLEAVSR